MAPDAAGGAAPGRAPPAGTSRPRRSMSTYITAIAAGPYHAVRSEHDGIPLGIFCRQSLASYLDPDEIFEITRQGFDYFHARVRRPVPVRQVRPAVRARVQGRRDGERRLRDLPRGLHLPVAGHRHRPRGPGRDDPARDGAHVVRRPGHHALVGRPVAERVVRHLGRQRGAGRGHPLDRRLDRPSPRPGRPGRTGRTSCRPRTRSRPTSPTSRRSRSTSTASPTPRARRCSSSWSPTSAGTTSWPACATTSGSTPGATRRSPTCSRLAGAGLRPRPGRLVQGLAGDRRGEHAAAVTTSCDADGRFTSLRGAPGGAAEPPGAAPAPHRDRPVRPRPRQGLTRRRRVELDVDRRARPRCRSWSASTRPDLVLVNDDDLTYAKIRLDDHSLRTLIAAIGEFTDPLPAALCWAAAWDMSQGRRDGRRATTSRLVAVRRGRRSSEITVLQTVLRQAALAVRRYADPAWRAAGLAAARRHAA